MLFKSRSADRLYSLTVPGDNTFSFAAIYRLYASLKVMFDDLVSSLVSSCHCNANASAFRAVSAVNERVIFLPSIDSDACTRQLPDGSCFAFAIYKNLLDLYGSSWYNNIAFCAPGALSVIRSILFQQGRAFFLLLLFILNLNPFPTLLFQLLVFGNVNQI